jgi:superfamily I DNA/RNA helicase
MALELLKLFTDPDPNRQAFKTCMKYLTGDAASQDAKTCTKMLLARDYVPGQENMSINGLETLITKIIEYSRVRKRSVTDVECIRAMRDLTVLNDESTFVSQGTLEGAIQTILDLALKGNSIDEIVSIVEGMKNNHKKTSPETADIVICTMHASKGMEFPLVFIVGANDEITPGIRVDEEPTLDLPEEERRLFYVALTRAEDHAVVMSWRFSKDVREARINKNGEIDKRSIRSCGPPSRFIGQAEIQMVEDKPFLKEARERAKRLEARGDEQAVPAAGESA